MITNDRVDVLLAGFADDLGEPSQWPAPDEYRRSLALCIIDAIASTRSHYTSVEKILDRYRAYRAEQGGDAADDSATVLLATFDEVGGPEQWADRIGNRKPTSTSANAPLKAAAIADAARALLELGIDTAEQFRSADTATLDAAEVAWKAVPGQRSGLTWSYVVMLAGVPGPADHLVSRYVCNAVGLWETELPDDAVAALVAEAAACSELDTELLEYAIWRFESKRTLR
ncbi:heme peroxidase [Antrihabitans stalactiti]|uniref:Heme peroxidase n=1 Tax=Antrihabitans stalactiti TaxID=2584121 RepID=A0A848KJ65_9NOCA|nr:heme peroxidase [Antrihabitans stalactiti]NMN98745.1 heme peroxidase [Antrihabitans stalactiti]